MNHGPLSVVRALTDNGPLTTTIYELFAKVFLSSGQLDPS